MPAKDVENGSPPKKGSRRLSRYWTALWRPFQREQNSPDRATDQSDLKDTLGKHNSASAGSSSAPDGVYSDEATKPKEDKYTDAENADCCSKLWSVYVDEADRYDKRLVESWKGDMDGMLIFSGLYSASLTAFLIESYKTLQPDTGDATVNLLSQISLQLAAASIGNALPDMKRNTEPFHPTTAALVCNVLWFLSLALSLTCALLATLITQWARDFLHKTEMRPSPVRRARIFSFLYFGMKKFRMHTVVDIIPMILHASLFFFFAGLVGFLIPVNHMLTILMGSILGIFLILYMIITALPLLYLDCPYHTPLSSALWNLWRTMRPWILASGSFTFSASHSMTDAMVVESFRDTARRDERAIEWTLASLTDDTELLPFVDAIPDALNGPKGFHTANNHLFLPILATPDKHLSIGTRIANFLQGSGSPSLDVVTRTRRQNACLKAIWELAMTAGRQTPDTRDARPSLWFDKSLLDVLHSETLDRHYAASALAAVRYCRMANLKPFFEHFARDLHGCITASEVFQARDRLLELVADVDMSPLDMNYPRPSFLRRLVENTENAGSAHGARVAWHVSWSRMESAERRFYPFSENTSGIKRDIKVSLDGLKQLLLDLNTDSSWAVSQMQILAPFLSECLLTQSCPYEFDLICETLMPKLSSPFHVTAPSNVPVWHPTRIRTRSYISVPHVPEICDLDRIIRMSIRLYSLRDSLHGGDRTRGFMWTAHRYIAKRNSENAVRFILDGGNYGYLQSTITRCLPVNAAPSWNPKTKMPSIYLQAAQVICEIEYFDRLEVHLELVNLQPPRSNTVRLERHPTIDFATGVLTVLRGKSTAPHDHAYLMAIVSGTSLQDLHAAVGINNSARFWRPIMMGDVGDAGPREKSTVNLLSHPLVRLHLEHQPDLWIRLKATDVLSAELTGEVLSIVAFSILCQFLAACADGPIQSGSRKVVTSLACSLASSWWYSKLGVIYRQAYMDLKLQDTFAQAVIDLVLKLQSDPGCIELKELVGAVWGELYNLSIAFDIENCTTIAEARFLYRQIAGVEKRRPRVVPDARWGDEDATISGLSPTVEKTLRDGGRSDLITRIVDITVKSLANPDTISKDNQKVQNTSQSSGSAHVNVSGGPSGDTEVLLDSPQQFHGGIQEFENSEEWHTGKDENKLFIDLN